MNCGVDRASSSSVFRAKDLTWSWGLTGPRGSLSWISQPLLPASAQLGVLRTDRSGPKSVGGQIGTNWRLLLGKQCSMQIPLDWEGASVSLPSSYPSSRPLNGPSPAFLSFALHHSLNRWFPTDVCSDTASVLIGSESVIGIGLSQQD